MRVRAVRLGVRRAVWRGAGHGMVVVVLVLMPTRLAPSPNGKGNIMRSMHVWGFVHGESTARWPWTNVPSNYADRRALASASTGRAGNSRVTRRQDMMSKSGNCNGLGNSWFTNGFVMEVVMGT